MEPSFTSAWPFESLRPEIEGGIGHAAIVRRADEVIEWDRRAV